MARSKFGSSMSAGWRILYPKSRVEFAFNAKRNIIDTDKEYVRNGGAQITRKSSLKH